jgi:hypothetical protein
VSAILVSIHEQLLDPHIVRIGLHVVEPDRLVRQHPARERRRRMRQDLRKIADPTPLLDDTLVDLAGFRIGLFRLDHFDARHHGLLANCTAI